MDINSYLQKELKKREIPLVSAVEAASWLNDAGILKDSEQRPGKPLRKLLREGRILGASQDPPIKYGKWFIKNIP